MREAVIIQVDYTAAAQIIHNRNASFSPQSHQRFHICLFGKAHNTKIARVHFQHQAGFFVYCLFIITQTRTVGCAHFPQPSGAFAHNFRNTEFAADLY